MPSDNVVLIGSLDMYSKRNDTPTVVQHDGETHVSYPPNPWSAFRPQNLHKGIPWFSAVWKEFGGACESL